MDQEYFPMKEVAKWLGVSTPTVHRLAKKGTLPFYRIGNSVRFKKVDIEEYLQKNRQGRPTRSYDRNE